MEVVQSEHLKYKMMRENKQKIKNKKWKFATSYQKKKKKKTIKKTIKKTKKKQPYSSSGWFSYQSHIFPENKSPRE